MRVDLLNKISSALDLVIDNQKYYIMMVKLFVTENNHIYYYFVMTWKFHHKLKYNFLWLQIKVVTKICFS